MKNTEVPKDLLFNFFLNFSKFEFALKTSRFAAGNEKKVSPDWDRFAASLKNIFDKTQNETLTNAINYFLNNPPCKQVLIKDVMSWNASVPNNGISEIETVLLLIRRVRNNLFHGGKFNSDIHKDKGRTITLLKSSLVILNACLPLAPEVENNYKIATI